MPNACLIQPLVIPYTESHKLKSEVNNVEYELFVALPSGYRDSKKEYPVIFITDPNFLFPILLGVTKSLVGEISDAIIVGIGHADLDFKELDRKTENRKRNIHRARDLLPWKFSDFDKYFLHTNPSLENEMVENSGRAIEFKDFIETKIVPFIDKTYKTKPERTLIGHSFGAIFTSWVMLNYPKIFQKYIAISPVLDLENGAMFKEISHASKTISAKIYFCAGELEANRSSNKNFIGDLKKFQQQISLSKNLTTKVEIFEGEYHSSVVPFAISKGLRFVN